jgi:hypothetical protein
LISKYFDNIFIPVPVFDRKKMPIIKHFDT